MSDEPEVAYVDERRVAEFRELGFDETQSLLLALNGADPKVVAYRLELCGMTRDQAVAIYA